MLDEMHGPPWVADTLRSQPTDNEPIAISPDDSRYDSLLDGYNHRFRAQPSSILVARNTEQVLRAVQDAVDSGRRIVARSGGHSFEDLASSADIELLLDLSQMAAVDFDSAAGAFVIEPGAKLGDVYRTLFTRWGVTIPGGSCMAVSAGGHVAGGGYGHLSRRYGLVADHLYALEIVVVDAAGQAQVVVATREPDDPHRDLWWAHTGGGGGNFGVVTRYWLRSPNVDSRDPAQLLPQAPSSSLRRTVAWSWETVSEAHFTKLMTQYCQWYEANSAPDSKFAPLWSVLHLGHRSGPEFWLTAVIDASVPNARALLDEHVDGATAGLPAIPVLDTVQDIGWLTQLGWPPDEVYGRYKHKAGDLRSRYDDRQLAAIWRHLSSSDYTNPAAFFALNGYGCQVNAVASADCAIAQRDSILTAVYSTGRWESAAEDETHLGWVREFYRDVYAGAGGVPVPNAVSDGSYINYADVDLADPTLNTSGLAWHDLFYKDNYPRLQAVKSRYDPTNVFHHALSVQLPG
jgi:hypothetical protein